MTESELISMIVDEITEYELNKYRKSHNKEYDILNEEISCLGDKVQKLLANLPDKDAEIIQTYIEKHSSLADRDCTFLYMQGAKDCIKLLKYLDVL